MRSENLEQLTPDGWCDLLAYGIRTIVDLRTPVDGQSASRAVPDVTIVGAPLHLGLDDDPEYAGWNRDRVLSTPLYYRRFLDRWPERVGAALVAIADAEPGGVLVHCEKGRDRTGLVVLVVLSMLGVAHKDIVDDYLLSTALVRTPTAARLGAVDTNQIIEELLRRRGTTAQSALGDVSRWLDTARDDLLSRGGVTAPHREAIVTRMLAPASEHQ